MLDARPNPDALLSRLAKESGKEGRGRLKVFFGANAGVGKTYAMLEAAQALRGNGERPLVGVVETHGRRETEALLDGLESLPRRAIEHRGISLREFDLDAALARAPRLVLVDELAHTNAAGSRHEKRWQDVAELLTAGIDVFTTVNVQHIESLNDVVEKITGVKVRETVPDQVLEQADEIVLVDLPPQVLLQRLREGKVYAGPQAARAADGFFKTGNLLALRELALRFVAKRVNVAVQVYRDAEANKKTWATQERLLVAVGPSPTSAKLVRATKRLATNLGAEWIAVSASTPQSHGPTRPRGSAWRRTSAWRRAWGRKSFRCRGPTSPIRSSHTRATGTSPRSSRESRCGRAGASCSVRRPSIG
jgi:two-component system sensor histidine kinase KdpD